MPIKTLGFVQSQEEYFGTISVMNFQSALISSTLKGLLEALASRSRSPGRTGGQASRRSVQMAKAPSARLRKKDCKHHLKHDCDFDHDADCNIAYSLFLLLPLVF